MLQAQLGQGDLPRAHLDSTARYVCCFDLFCSDAKDKHPTIHSSPPFLSLSPPFSLSLSSLSPLSLSLSLSSLSSLSCLSASLFLFPPSPSPSLPSFHLHSYFCQNFLGSVSACLANAYCHSRLKSQNQPPTTSVSYTTCEESADTRGKGQSPRPRTV